MNYIKQFMNENHIEEEQHFFIDLQGYEDVEFWFTKKLLNLVSNDSKEKVVHSSICHKLLKGVYKIILIKPEDLLDYTMNHMEHKEGEKIIHLPPLMFEAVFETISRSIPRVLKRGVEIYSGKMGEEVKDFVPVCPNCYTKKVAEEELQKFCKYCGQCFDWSHSFHHSELVEEESRYDLS